MNARATGSATHGGDGSEESPWWGLDTAVGQLIHLDRVGKLPLGEGQSVRLHIARSFTATSIEKRKKIKEASPGWFSWPPLAC